MKTPLPTKIWFIIPTLLAVLLVGQIGAWVGLLGIQIQIGLLLIIIGISLGDGMYGNVYPIQILAVVK